MRVLIVGCGYVGLPLGAELVRQGHTVFGLRRSADDGELKAAGITPLHADITRAETLTGLPREFDWVVNCTASGGGDAEAYRQLYLVGNRNLINWLTAPTHETPSPLLRVAQPSRLRVPAASRRSWEHGAGRPVNSQARTPALQAPRLKRFIYTSSTSVYGQNDGSLVVETDPVHPPTDMGEILVATENLLLAAAAAGGASVPASRSDKGSRVRSPHPFPVVILRLAGIYGPGRGHWFKQFLHGEARLEGDGSRFLNMIHRDDVVGAIIAALQGGAPVPSVFNVVDDEPVSQRDFFGWLAAQLGEPMPPSVPADAEANRKRGVTSKRVSNQRLKKVLGYQFKYPTFRQGYTEAIERLARGRA